MACAHAQVTPPRTIAAIPGDAQRLYTIWLGGAQVGMASETERWSARGVVLVRMERMRFLRGDIPIELTTTIEIIADRSLVASHVIWTERAASLHSRALPADLVRAPSFRHGEAVREGGGWTVTTADTELRLPIHAIPGELMPLVIRRDGRFSGDVFMPARGFLVATGRIDPIAPDRLVARLAYPGGAVAVTVTFWTATYESYSWRE